MLPSLLVAIAALGQVAPANVRPQIGYVYPPGGQAGTTVEFMIGGYDWTPDMQLFPHDPRLKIEITGPAGEPILTPPPYWFGAKAGQAQPPLPREIPARITIPADLPPGTYRWQAANANGGTNVGSFVVSGMTEVVEPQYPPEMLDLPNLPVAVSGRVSRITEIDQYRFTASETGLVACRLDDRLGQPFFGALTIRDSQGRIVADAADTAGKGLALAFLTQAGEAYTASIHDVEFGGDRGYVYRLSLERGPLVLATRPLNVQAGYSGPVEVVGWGVASGKLQLEAAIHQVAIPAGIQGTHPLSVDTPAGRAVAALAIGESTDSLEPAATDIAAREVPSPVAIAGVLERLEEASQMPIDRYRLTSKVGEVRRIVVEAARFGSAVDPSLAILGPDGKEIARSDDLPGTTDAALDFTAPADGAYEIVVADFSGTEPGPASVYRVTVESPAEVADFSLQIADRLDLPLGGTANLAVKAVRRGAWKEPITLKLEGLPAGVSPPADLAIGEGKSDASLALAASDQAAATASLVNVVATATVGGRTIERRAGPVLVATTLKPRCQVQSAVQDGGRLVNRGTTYPAEVIIQRLEGYTGPVTLQMAAAQQRQRRGMRGSPVVVPAGVSTALYPIFMPEWLETNLTCRMNVVGVTEIPDPQGNVRHVIGNMDGLIVMSLEGGLMKLSHEPGERTVQPGQTIEIPVRLSRSAKLPAAARIEVVSEGEQAGLFTAEPIALAANESEAIVRLQVAADPRARGVKEVTIRATAMQNGQWPAVSETQVPLTVAPAK